MRGQSIKKLAPVLDQILGVGSFRPPCAMLFAMGRLLLLFIGVPVIELALLIEIGGCIGTLATLALIVGTGVLGAALARQQGLSVLRRMREEVAAGRLPAGSMLDGVTILIAGTLLMTPGILTDAVGFLCLVPAVRALAKRELLRRLEGAIREGRVTVSVHEREFDPFAPPSPDRPNIEGTPRRDGADPEPDDR